MQSSSTSSFHHIPTFRPKFQKVFLSKNRPLLGTQFRKPRMASLSGGRVGSQTVLCGSLSTGDNNHGSCSLMDYVGKRGINVEDDLVVLLYYIQYACKKIAALVASPFNYTLGKHVGLGSAAGGGSDRDAPKPLDIVSVMY